MDSIVFLNDFLSEKDESKRSYALASFLSSLSPSDLNKILFPRNVLRYQKLATGKAGRFLISDETEFESAKETILYLIGIEIASRSNLHSIALPPQIIHSLIRCGIWWLNQTFAGATSEMTGPSWNSFFVCALPDYVLSVDGKPHQFKFANGNERIMRQGWVRRGDLINEVAANDKNGSFNQLQAPNAKFFHLHPEINFQVVCRSLFLNFLENKDKCFTRLLWGAFTMADVEDCMAEAVKFLAMQEVAAINKSIADQSNICKLCKKPIPSERRAHKAKYCSPQCYKNAANQRTKSKHR